MVGGESRAMLVGAGSDPRAPAVAILGREGLLDQLIGKQIDARSGAE